MVEANREGKTACPPTQLAEFRDIELDRLPVILKEGLTTLTSTYYIGKQTLKDNYFGQAAILI